MCFVPFALVACDDESIKKLTDTLEVISSDTGGAEATVSDTAVAETVAADSAPSDTGVAETIAADTGPSDTTVTETVATETTLSDTTVAETVATDTVVATETSATETVTTTADTVADTTVTDTTVADTAPTDTGPTTCPYENTAPVVTNSTIFKSQTYGGATDQLKYTSNLCSDEPDSKEKAYKLQLSEHSEIYVETDCGWDCEIIVTKNQCMNADVIECSASIGEEQLSLPLDAGTYYVMVEGDNPEDVQAYDLMVNVHHTGGQAQCVATTADVVTAANCVSHTFSSDSYEYTLTNQTLSAADVDDFFIQDVDGCTSDQNHVGGAPDKVYKLVLPAGTKGNIEVTLKPDGWDGMLYVTTAPCGAAAQVVACSDGFGDETVTLTGKAPGTYYVVVDGFGEEVFTGGASGSFDLDFVVEVEDCP